MLAACAQDFDVVEEVGQALGFPPKVEARHAETCVYIVGRLRSYLSVAKWAKTEEQRQDVHVVLGAAAPRRKEGDTDPDCMIERVAETLGVTPGKRYHKASGTQRPRVYEEDTPTAEDIEALGMEQGDDVFFLVNSTELRMVGFQMDPVDHLPTPSAHISHRTRRASSAPERASSKGRRFRLPADVENQGLAMCW